MTCTGHTLLLFSELENVMKFRTLDDTTNLVWTAFPLLWLMIPQTYLQCLNSFSVAKVVNF
jgi:hypothetical protein